MQVQPFYIGEKMGLDYIYTIGYLKVNMGVFFIYLMIPLSGGIPPKGEYHGYHHSPALCILCIRSSSQHGGPNIGGSVGDQPGGVDEARAVKYRN